MPDTPTPGSSTKRSTPFNIHEYVATFFLPDSMLDYFDIVWAEEKTITCTRTRKHDERYKTEFHMYLDEKDNRPEELKNLRPNGFTEETVIDDFPVRNRKLILHVRRRRWLDDDGDNLERAYKYHLSGYPEWDQIDHADKWMLKPENIGENLSIDETSLHDDLFTFLSNKAGHCRQGTIVAAVRGTKAEDVISILMQIPEENRLAVK